VLWCGTAVAISCPAGQEVDCTTAACVDCGEGYYSTAASTSCTNCVACTVTNVNAVGIAGVTTGTSYQQACTINSPPPPPEAEVSAVSSPPPPPPSPTSSPSPPSCFPGSSVVGTPSGPRRISDLVRGDKVSFDARSRNVCGCAGNRLHRDTVYILQVLAISNGKAMYRTVSVTGACSKLNQISTFVEVALDNNATLRATAGHYIPVGGRTFAKSSPLLMEEVVVGDKMWVLPDHNTFPVAAYIVSVSHVQDKGRYKVHTASDGIIVNGVVAHEHSNNFPFRSVSVYKVVNFLPWAVTVAFPPSVSKTLVLSFEFLANAVHNSLLR